MMGEKRNLLPLARKARDNEDFEKAADYYEEILEMDPDSWEAAYYSMYGKLRYSNISNMIISANTVEDHIENIIGLVAKADLIPQEKYYILSNISNEIIDIASKTFELIKLDKIDGSNFNRYKKIVEAWSKALYALGYFIYDDFYDLEEKNSKLCIKPLETCNEFASRILNATNTLVKMNYHRQLKVIFTPLMEDATEIIRVFHSGYDRPKDKFRLA